VKEIRKAYELPAFSKTKHETADFVHLRQAAEQLEVSSDAVRRLIKFGLINAKQIVRHVGVMDSNNPSLQRSTTPF